MTTKITQANTDFSVTEWQSVKTSDFTAVAGEGYFVNTTSGAITVTLPVSPSAGDVIVLKDYARTWNTNNVTIASALLDGDTTTSSFSTNGQTVTLVYMDGTKGWSLVNEDTTSKLSPTFMAATGGTVTTTGDFKIHTFTGDGCFVVSQLGGCGPTDGPSNVDYLVIAGGGSGTTQHSGGGGAGGYRTTFPSPGCNAGAFPVSITTYPITVGAGGAALPAGSGVVTGNGNPGSNSVFSTITSTGGGGAGRYGNQPGLNGGSGGGGASDSGTGGSGNTPPVSPPQGNNGGNGALHNTGGGGGGGGGGSATSGSNATAGGSAGNGGAGTQNNIDGNNYYWAGGGGGGIIDTQATNNAAGNGGIGGGGGGANKRNSAGGAGGGSALNPGTNGGTQPAPTAGGPAAGGPGGANTGGGGGGSGSDTGDPSGGGGKGIVIIRYKFQ